MKITVEFEVGTSPAVDPDKVRSDFIDYFHREGLIEGHPDLPELEGWGPFWVESAQIAPEPIEYVRDPDSGVVYHSIPGGWIANFPDGKLEIIYLNPSGGSDDGVPNVFLYHEEGNLPKYERAVTHFVMGETD